MSHGMRTPWTYRLRRVDLAAVAMAATALLAGCAPATKELPAPSPVASPVAPTPTAIRQPIPAQATPERENRAAATPTPRSMALRSDTPRPAGLPKLHIPRIEVATPMVAVGLDPDGNMDAPQVGDVVGWYSLGPLPGSTGNAVLAGHVDWDKRPAVFWRLREVEPGDEMMLEFSDGNRLTYRVQWSEQYPAGAEPLGRVYENLTVPALTLITCTGDFDRGSRGYRDRLVVRAVRA